MEDVVNLDLSLCFDVDVLALTKDSIYFKTEQIVSTVKIKSDRPIIPTPASASVPINADVTDHKFGQVCRSAPAIAQEV